MEKKQAHFEMWDINHLCQGEVKRRVDDRIPS